MFGKKNKDNKWFKNLYVLYRKNKLSAPYRNLFYYYFNSSYSAPIKGNRRGHFEIFSGAKFDDFFNELTKDLRQTLPQHLFENYTAALEKFNALGEDPDYEEIENAFDEYDFYAYEHEEEINNILKNYYLRLE